MTRNRLAWKALAVASATALVLAACGGDDDDTGSEPTEEESAPAAAAGDGTLKIGSILPQTGSLAFLGPPEFAGVDLAVQEINEAGGVLGQDVAVSHGDSGDTTTNTASVTVDRLLSEDVDAIIGAASSAVTLTVIDKITGAGVVQFSPANTSTTLSTYADNGLYFRTAPPDQFQGAVLADQVASDGAATAGVLALQDSYGDSLKSVFIDSFTEAGGEVVAELTYDPAAADFSADVGQIAAADPDAIVLIGFEESGKVVEAMFAAGIGPDTEAALPGRRQPVQHAVRDGAAWVAPGHQGHPARRRGACGVPGPTQGGRPEPHGLQLRGRVLRRHDPDRARRHRCRQRQR